MLSWWLWPTNHHPARIKKAEKYFAKKLDFENIRFPVKFRGICEIVKTNSISISLFAYENKEKQPIFVSKKCCAKKHVDLLLIEEKKERADIFLANI